MADIAARAKVSVALVSRTLSGDPKRARVLVSQRIIDSLSASSTLSAHHRRCRRTRVHPQGPGLQHASQKHVHPDPDIGDGFPAVARRVEDVAQFHG